MFDPDLVLPVTHGCLVKRSQAALHLLGAIDTLAQAQYFKLEVGPEVLEKPSGPVKAYTLQDFSAVNRFESKFIYKKLYFLQSCQLLCFCN